MLIRAGKCLGRALRSTASDIWNLNAMGTQEAMKILDIKDGLERAELENQYRKMYERNKRESPYLAEKISGAYSVLRNRKI